MKSPRVYLSPLVAVVTLAIGIALVGAIDVLASWFSSPVAVEHKPETPTSPRYDFYSAPRVEIPPPPATTELSCYDPTILPVWRELKNDREFIDRTHGWERGLDCSSLLDVKRVDLNRDREPEFLVRGKDVPLCGGTGNCLFWIFGKNGNRLGVLMAESDYVDVAKLGEQVLKSRTRGYSDILLRGHFSAAETGYYTFTFNGARYVETRCLYEVPNEKLGTDGGWEMITCEAFHRRQQRELDELSSSQRNAAASRP